MPWHTNARSDRRESKGGGLWEGSQWGWFLLKWSDWSQSGSAGSCPGMTVHKCSVCTASGVIWPLTRPWLCPHWPTKLIYATSDTAQLTLVSCIYGIIYGNNDFLFIAKKWLNIYIKKGLRGQKKGINRKIALILSTRFKNVGPKCLVAVVHFQGYFFFLISFIICFFFLVIPDATWHDFIMLLVWWQ